MVHVAYTRERILVEGIKLKAMKRRVMADEVEALWKDTGGNPFTIDGSLRLWLDGGIAWCLGPDDEDLYLALKTYLRVMDVPDFATEEAARNAFTSRESAPREE